LAESYESAANKFLNEANYVEAIKNYIYAADSYKYDGGIFLEDAANCYNNAATLYTEMGNFDRAIVYYQKAIDCFLQIENEIEDKKSFYHDLVACCEDLGISSTSIEDYKSATDFFIKALEFLARILEIEDELVKKYIQNQIVIDYALCALCFLMNDEEKKAVNFIQQSAKIAHEIESPQEIGAQTAIFAVHMLKKDHDKALEILKDEIEPKAPLFSARSMGLQAQIMALLYSVFHKYFPEEQLYYHKGENNDGLVKIREKAYRMIALHSIFYANRNMPREDWKEIYGLLIGKLEKDNVVITDAIPITSGKKYEVEFNEEHYSKAAEIDEIAIQKKLFTVGWYHSHPGIGLFLSTTDIINHLGYQSVNPKAVALVFDFTDLGEENPGFKIFKLTDPELGSASQYHLVSWKIIGKIPNYSKIEGIGDNFLKDVISLCKNNKKMTYSEMAKEIGASKFIIKELLPEIIKQNKLDVVLCDRTEKYMSKNLFFRALLDLSRQYNPLSIETVINEIGVSRKQALEGLEEMIYSNLIRGEIHLATDEFIKK
jgi:proteasome lid subunit RPN8/RPN11